MDRVQELIYEAKNSSEYWEELTQMEFVTFLNEEMQKQGITQKQMADRLDVSKAYISRVLSGEKLNFTLKSMIKFMFALGRHICFLSKPLKNKPARTFSDIVSMIFFESSDEEEALVLGNMEKADKETVLTGSLAA